MRAESVAEVSRTLATGRGGALSAASACGHTPPVKDCSKPLHRAATADRRGGEYRWLAVVQLLLVACANAPSKAPSPLRPSAEPSGGSVSVVAQRLRADEPSWQSNHVMRQLGTIRSSLRSSRYTSELSIDQVNGRYDFDCSAMAGWILAQATPQAYSALVSSTPRRPRAKDFHRLIAAIPPGQERDGWVRVARVSDVRAGDIIAWLRPRRTDSNNTGHVAFAALVPRRLPGYENAFFVRVVDASSDRHGDDTRAPTHTGFGIGTIGLATTVHGEPTHYSWTGHLERFVPTTIVIGRALR